MSTKQILIYVGILFSALGLLYAFKGVDFGRLAAKIGGLRFWPFLWSLLSFSLLLVLRGVRWRCLLIKLKGLPFLSVFSALGVGLLANNILPGRMGEVVRAVCLGRREKISSASILANVLIEHIADVLAICVLLFWYLLYSDRGAANRSFVLAGWGFLAASLGAVVGIMLIRRFEARSVKFVEGIVGRFSATLAEKLGHLLKSFISGLNFLESWAHFVLLTGLSLLIWLAGAYSVYFLFQSFAIDASFLDSVFVFVAVIFGIAIPSAPGYVGTFHALVVTALAVIGVHDGSLAAAYATVLHGMQWSVVSIIGALFLVREGGDILQEFWKTRVADPVS